jgi:hypothetical protein
VRSRTGELTRRAVTVAIVCSWFGFPRQCFFPQATTEAERTDMIPVASEDTVPNCRTSAAALEPRDDGVNTLSRKRVHPAHVRVVNLMPSASYASQMQPFMRTDASAVMSNSAAKRLKQQRLLPVGACVVCLFVIAHHLASTHGEEV